MDTIEGRNPVMEALRAGRTINKIFVARGSTKRSVSEIVSLAKRQGILIDEVERIHLDRMSTTGSHQGIIALTAARGYVDVDDILSNARQKEEDPLVIVLDGIEDPHNLGSIIRTCDAVGAHGVIIPERRAVGLTAAVGRASAGAIEHVLVARVTNLVRTLNDLKNAGLWVCGASAQAEQNHYDAKLDGALALVIGSEGRGISRLTRETCDFLVKIPMSGNVNSLNASVAAAVMMYEVYRQRRS